MNAKYIQKGGAMDYTASTPVAAGQLVVVGTVAGVAGSDIAAGETGALILGEVFDLEKDASTFNQGDKVYYDADAEKVTSTEASNTLIGYAFATAATGAASVAVKLNA